MASVPVSLLVPRSRRAADQLNLSVKITVAVCLIVLAAVGAGGWLIWDKLPSWQVQRLYLMLGAWTVVGVGVSAYFAVRYITSPLSDLTQMAQHLGEGQLGERIRVVAGGEIGQLAGAFNDMAASLEAARVALEQEMAVRTRELEYSQLQLLQAAKLASVGELAGGVAHEINNPASIILMRLARLSAEIRDHRLSGEAEEDVATIQRQVEKISRIVSGLLTFSRQSTSEPKPLNVNDVARRTASLMEELVRSSGVELDLALTADLPDVAVDAGQIEQVLLNLTNNAVDAMPGGGKLTFGSEPVRLTDGSPAVAMFVEDGGTGIRREDLSRIFDPFFTTKDAGQGTGLGLSISYGIIEQHGGSIEVDSHEGEGTRFTIYLPVAAPDSATRAQRPEMSHVA